MELVFNKVKGFILWVGPTITLAVIVLIGLYIFWKECSRSRKNNSSVFDVYLFSVFWGLAFARIANILSHLSEYFDNIWYWLPYEKYGDQIYLFRLLPWRFLRIWDGELDLLYLFVGMILIQTLWTTVRKKWKWSDLFPAIFLSNWAMIGLAFLLLGIQWGNDLWSNQGLMLFVPLLVFLVLQIILVDTQRGFRVEKMRLVLQVAFSVVSMIIILYIYFTLPQVKVVTTIGVLIWILWGIIGTISHVISSKQKTNVTIEKVSSVRHLTLPDSKRPVRLFRK